MEVITVEKLIEEGKRSFGESLVSSLSETELIRLLENTPVAQQLRAEGRAESHRTLVKNVALILAIRFQADRDEWQERLTPLTIDQLDQLTEMALLTQTIEEFETEFDQLLPPKAEL